MLPLVPTDSANEKQHRTLLATTLNELVKLYPREGSWTASVAGSGTAGTYEIASQVCRYTRIGRRVWLDLNIALDATITGGGTGNFQIAGIPFAKANDGSVPIGAMRTSLNFSAAWCVLQFNSTGASSHLVIIQAQDDATGTIFPISSAAASKDIRGSISYETDAP